VCGTLNLAYFQDFAERLAAPFVKRVIPNSFAESGRETDRTMRLECRGRKQVGAATLRTHVRTSRSRPSRFKRLVKSLPCPPSECRLGMTNLNQFPNCCASYSKLLLPAVAVPRIATFPDTPPVESAKLAIPLMSDCTVAFDSARMTGIAG
jgi:hypothetical protein